MRDVDRREAERRAAPERLAGAVELLVFTTLVFAPFAFGAVEAWAQLVVIGLVALAAIFWGIHPRAPAPSFAIRSPVTWLFAALVILVCLQLLELPAGLAAFLSPRTVALKRELLADIPGAAEGGFAISFHPFATKGDLRMLLAAGLVFFLVLDTVRSLEQVKRFLWLIVCVGIGLGLLALFERLAQTGRLYGLRELTEGGTPAASFVNRNNFAGFINMCVGAGAALAILSAERFAKGGIGRLGGRETGLLWLLWFGTAVMASMVFLCLSRGGMLSFIAAGLLLLMGALWKRGVRGRSWLLAAGVAAGAALVVWLGFDEVYRRILTLLGGFEDLRHREARFGLWKDILGVMVGRFPLLGIGLGCHRHVYPMFKTLPWGASYTHAENEYVQLTEETGLVGIAIVLATAAFVLRSLIRGIVKGRSRAVAALQLGLGFSLVSNLFHALGDFGLHIPANACLFATVCALILVLERLGAAAGRREEEPEAIALPASGRLRWRPLALLLLLPALVWMAFSGARAAVAERAFARYKGLRDALRLDQAPAERDWRRMRELAVGAARAEPENARYRFEAAKVRWHQFEAGVRSPEEEVPEAEAVMPDLVRELDAIRVLAPTHGPALVLMGQIEYLYQYLPFVESGKEEDRARAEEAKRRAEKHIRLGRRLDPTNPAAWYAAGYLEVREGRPEEAADSFRRSLSLGRDYLPDIVDIYLNEFGRPEEIVKACPDDLGVAGELLRTLRALKAPAEVIDALEARWSELLEEALEEDPSSLAALRARAEYLRGKERFEEAIPLYRRAIRLAFGDVGLHYSLALTLERTGRRREALGEALRILSRRPEHAGAEALRARLAEKAGGDAAPR